MKTYLIAFFVIASSSGAADVSHGLRFNDTMIPLSGIHLSDEPADRHATLPYRSGYAGFSSLDLIAPDSTRQDIIQHVAFPLRSGKLRLGSNGIRSGIIRVPLSTTDLIGPASDREKVIEHVRATIEAQPAVAK